MFFHKENRITLRDLYEQYWHCRDFEIKNLWQRSVFLGTFLVLCFTGYGAFFGKAFFEGSTLVVLNCGDDASICHIEMKHLIAFFLAVVGSFFSVLWIAMAKASKAWVETYERAIDVIEKEMTKNNCLKNFVSFNFHKFPDYYYVGKDTFFDDIIFSSKGGYFSPSRLNIVLGQTALVVWILVELFHLSFLFRMTLAFCCCRMVPTWGLSLFLALIVVIAQMCVYSYLKHFISSDTLRVKDPRKRCPN